MFLLGGYMVYEVTKYIFYVLLPCMLLGFFIGNVVWVILTAMRKKRQVEREMYAYEYAAKQERFFWHNMRYFMFADSIRYNKDAIDGKGALRFYTLSCSCCEYKTNYVYKKLEDAVKEVLTMTKAVEKVVRDISVKTVSEILDE